MFFNFTYSTRYQKVVSSGRSGGSAFTEPTYITRNIISLQQKVYEYIASPTKISKEHYEDLFNRGLLDNRYPALDTFKQGRRERDSAQKAKKIDVYAIRFLLTPKAKSAQSQGQQSQDTLAPDDLDASDPNAPGAFKKGQFAYTVMCKTSPSYVAVEY